MSKGIIFTWVAYAEGVAINRYLSGERCPALCAEVVRLRVSHHQNDETRFRNSLVYMSEANLNIAVHSSRVRVKSNPNSNPNPNPNPSQTLTLTG